MTVWTGTPIFLNQAIAWRSDCWIRGRPQLDRICLRNSTPMYPLSAPPASFGLHQLLLVL